MIFAYAVVGLLMSGGFIVVTEVLISMEERKINNQLDFVIV